MPLNLFLLWVCKVFVHLNRRLRRLTRILRVSDAGSALQGKNIKDQPSKHAVIRENTLPIPKSIIRVEARAAGSPEYCVLRDTRRFRNIGIRAHPSL